MEALIQEMKRLCISMRWVFLAMSLWCIFCCYIQIVQSSYDLGNIVSTAIISGITIISFLLKYRQK